jgi:hypothetical protein
MLKYLYTTYLQESTYPYTIRIVRLHEHFLFVITITRSDVALLRLHYAPHPGQDDVRRVEKYGVAHAALLMVVYNFHENGCILRKEVGPAVQGVGPFARISDVKFPRPWVHYEYGRTRQTLLGKQVLCGFIILGRCMVCSIYLLKLSIS